MYNLYHAPTTLGVQSWKDNISGGRRTNKVEYHWSRGTCCLNLQHQSKHNQNWSHVSPIHCWHLLGLMIGNSCRIFKFGVTQSWSAFCDQKAGLCNVTCTYLHIYSFAVYIHTNTGFKHSEYTVHIWLLQSSSYTTDHATSYLASNTTAAIHSRVEWG
jgi:hypothetical protein